LLSLLLLLLMMMMMRSDSEDDSYRRDAAIDTNFDSKLFFLSLSHFILYSVFTNDQHVRNSITLPVTSLIF